MSEETYYAQNPDPDKQGTKINKAKYDQIHQAITVALLQQSVMSLKELTLAVQSQLEGVFEGSIPWYVTTVKLDMESRGELVCDRKKSPVAHYLAG